MLKDFPVVQVYVQEAQEFQTGIDDLRYRRKAGSKSASANKNLATEWDIPNVSTIRATLMLYTKALQQGLQVCLLLQAPEADLGGKSRWAVCMGLKTSGMCCR